MVVPLTIRVVDDLKGFLDLISVFNRKVGKWFGIVLLVLEAYTVSDVGIAASIIHNSLEI